MSDRENESLQRVAGIMLGIDKLAEGDVTLCEFITALRFAELAVTRRFIEFGENKEKEGGAE